MKNAVKIIIGLLLGIIVTYAVIIINNKSYSFFTRDESSTLISGVYCAYDDENCDYETLPSEVVPVIDGGLVPVKIQDDGTVKKVSTDNKNLEWYDYTGKVWANAVILKNKKIKDLSGHNNNATIHGATPTSEGLVFDGVDDYVVTDSAINYNNTKELTIEYKVKLNSQSGAKLIIESSANTNSNSGAYYSCMNQWYSNSLDFVTITNNTGYYIKTDSAIINNSTYDTYTITLNLNDSNALKLYKNGVLQSTTSAGTNASKVINDYLLYIGSRAGSGNFTSMTLKDLKIYTKELSQQEINNNLNGNTTSSNLILHYDLVNHVDIYDDGDTIPESDIESYFVWIPKFRYKLWNVNITNPDKKAHQIDIIFGDYDTTDKTGECATPMTSGNVGNCDNGEYMTHPAFLSMDTNGFWVGKFETGYNGATTVSEAQSNTADVTKVIIKPNVYSWTDISVGNSFVNSYNYLRNMDSHMMKNTEWGAVALLSHSKYGIGREVRINNNSDYKTGYAALPSQNQQIFPSTGGNDNTTTVAYNASAGVLASTTGNISGVYDMNGGLWEYVAGYHNSQSSSTTGLTPSSYNAKYFDLYNATIQSSNYEYRILGDATGEMGPFFNYKDSNGSTRYHNSWYGDVSGFFAGSNYWIDRGGTYNNGIIAGQFTFSTYTGGNGVGLGYRITLAPTN